MDKTELYKPSGVDEVRRLAYDRFDQASSSEFDNRKKSIEDIKFAQLEDAQWDDDAKQRRQNRPKYTINKVAVAVSQTIGEQRQGRIAIKVRPARGNATKKVADTYNGLIRNIENVSKAKNAYDMAFKYVANGGFGAWRIVTEYSDDDSFDQDIKIQQIASPLTQVWFDPLAKDTNKRDARYAFISYDIDLKDFKTRYPDANFSDFSRPEWIETYNRQWITVSTVRVAEYFVKESITKKLVLLSNGKVYDLKKFEPVADELAEAGITVVDKKTVKTERVMWYKLSGAEVLEGPKEWPGKFIPIIPVYGFNFYLNNVHYYRGMVRLAKDAQRIYNYETSAKIEITALSPKDPYWYTAKQAEGYKQDFENFNVTNSPFMPFNYDPANPGPPKRTGAPAVQQALIEQTRQADQDIKATTGKFAPSIGDNPRDQSGRAVVAQQQKGDAATYELVDNLSKAVEYTGEILVDLIPRVWDTPQQQRIIRDDGETEMVMVNQTVFDEESGKNVILNDLSQGKYDVVAEVGPSFSTKRTEALHFLTQLAASSQLFAQVSPDLMARNVDFPFAEELTRRTRKVMLQQGIIEPNEDEKAQMPKGPSPEEQQQMMALQLENELKAAKIDEIAAKNEKTLADALKLRADANKIMKGDADTPSTPEEEEAIQLNTELINHSLEQEKIEEEQALEEQALQQLGAGQPPQGDGVPA